MAAMVAILDFWSWTILATFYLILPTKVQALNRFKKMIYILSKFFLSSFDSIVHSVLKKKCKIDFKMVAGLDFQSWRF